MDKQAGLAHMDHRTKIVATVGPACDKYDQLLALVKAGVNVFRLNFSHGSHEDKKTIIDHIRTINKTEPYNIAILGDLQGPKLRVGVMKEDVVVSKGDKITFTTAEDILGTASRVYMNYKEFPKDVNPGERILLDDGKLIFEVVSTDRKEIVSAKVPQISSLL